MSDAFETFLFGDAQPLQEGWSWVARCLDWDPYRHMRVVMDVSLCAPDGTAHDLELSCSLPDGLDAAAREQVRAEIARWMGYRVRDREKP